ncbi:AEC family transporter [Arcobacteraceae bacterium]|nr:AEC family transporter [Arcobacteraceae bacterium]
MSNFIMIIIYILIGYILKNITLPIKELAVKLNKFVIYISLPAMIFLQIPKLEFTNGTLIPIVIAWSVMALSAILVLVISKYMDFSKEITGALMLVTVLTNSSFLGIPIISGYYGLEALPYILVYDQLGTFLALATYGTFVASYYSSESKVSLKIIAFKVISFPPFVSLVIAVFLSGVVYPSGISNILGILASTIVPFALVAVGLQLQFKLPRDEIKPFAVSLFIKLIIAPIIAIVICYIFGWNNFISKVSILEASMAPMITAAAMASMIGLAPRLSNAIVAYGILLSFFTSWVFFMMIA